MNSAELESSNTDIIVVLLTEILNEIRNSQTASNLVVFYSIKDVMDMTGWSENTVQKLFNDPKFPSSDYGKSKVIERTALISFFSTKHIRSKDRYWM